MKIIRSTPVLNFGRSIANAGPWSRHPLAGIPSVAQFLEDFFPATANAFAGRLATDVHEDAANYYVRFELPGVKKEAVKVEVAEGVLTVGADRTEKSGDSESTVTLSRSINLPDTVQVDGISAKLEDGILTVTLPKQEQPKPKQITVN
jgi:HSP20 family protein